MAGFTLLLHPFLRRLASLGTLIGVLGLSALGEAPSHSARSFGEAWRMFGPSTSPRWHGARVSFPARFMMKLLSGSKGGGD